MMDIWFENMMPHLTSLRKEFHAHYPELSHNEFRTAEKIRRYLREFTHAEIREVAKTGTVAIFNPESIGKTILIRADIDALPIGETNTFDHKSSINQVSHKCGHDGHTVILLGLARALTDFPVENCKIILLWQPAEETGSGAGETIQDTLFRDIPIDFAFALHNIPGYPLHQVILRKGLFTPQVKSMIIKLYGRTAHAAEPEHGQNPAMAISKIIQYAEAITENNTNKKDFFLITPVFINMGSPAYGTSAGYGEIHLTLRSWSPEIFNERSGTFISYIEEKAKELGLKTTISWIQEFYANVNNEEAVNYLIRASEACSLDMDFKQQPFKWGEDFGLFTQKYKGAMFGLGAGNNTPALHSPDYDFPDDIMMSGILVFYETIKQVVI